MVILIICIVAIIACIILIEESMERHREIEWKKKAREMYKECTGHYPEESEAVAKRQAQEFAERNLIEFVAEEGADHRFVDPSKMDHAIYRIAAFFGLK